MRFKSLTGCAMVGALVLTGCAGADGGDDADAPLKIAVIATSSGPLAKFGEDTLTAIEFAADQANENGGVDGHKVELVVVETDGTPAKTQAAVRKAVTQDQVSIIAGVLSSPEQIAVQPLLTSLGVVSMAYVSDDVLRGSDCSPNAFMTSQSNYMSSQAVAQGLPEEYLAGDWAISAVDVSSGHVAVENFTAAVEEAGGDIVAEEFSPSGTTDFGPQITKLKDSGANHLFVAQYGADAVAFINQGDQYDLFTSMETVVGSNMLSEPLFEAVGDKVIGFYNDVRYSPLIDTPENEEFVEAWRASEDAELYYITGGNYMSMQVLFAAVEEAGSVEPDEVRDALSGLEVDTIYGPVTMRAEDHQLLLPSYLGRVVEKEGSPAFEVVAEAPASETTPEPNPDCQL